MEVRRRHPAAFSSASESRVHTSESLSRRRRPLVLTRPSRSALQRLSKPKKVAAYEPSEPNASTLSGKRRRSPAEVLAPVSGGHLKLQRFAPSQNLVEDKADFCLYAEMDTNVHQDTLEDAHALVQVTASALRSAGCRVAVHMLQTPDSEVLAANQTETQAYALTIGSEVPDQSVTESGAWAGRVATQLAPWVTQHADFRSHVLPLSGAAQCQRLCKLILTELRLQLDVCCLHAQGHGNVPGAPVLLSAREKLLPQVMNAKGLTNVALYPLHRDEARRQLTRRWGAQSSLALPPLEDIYAYFGPRIAMYFAWLAFYTRMLLLPSVYGVVVHVLGMLNLAPSYTVHCVLVAIGTSLIADMWRRRQREVEFTWGYDGVLSSLHATTRMQFQGEWMQDPVTGARCFDFPHHKRLLRQLLAVPLLVSMCCLVGGYVIGLHVLSERLRASYSESCTQAWAQTEHIETGIAGTGYWSYVADNWIPSNDAATCAFVSHGPSVINAVIIYVMDNLYQLLARKLTEFENYRTLDEHEAHLVAKRMPFHLVNSNASLWFLAFYVRRLDRVRERLWILLVATQLLDNFKEVGLPLAVSVGGQVLTAENKRRRRQSLESLESDLIEESHRLLRKSSIPQLRAKRERERVDVVKAATEQRLARVLMQKRQATYRDSFADYKELMVQFGYVTLYSPVFPLAAAFAWLNNTIESRSDLLKLVNRHGYQRPVAQHARGIGVWEKVLVSFAGVAVVVNCALVWTYELDELLPTWTDLQRLAFIVACEHVIFVIKAWLNWAVPEVPVTSSLGKNPVLPLAEISAKSNEASLAALRS
ncbi:hypothetical protein KRP22_004840 [Phytophthora ramorum]|nr:Anoctamin-10 [Phytophthora ramorum]